MDDIHISKVTGRTVAESEVEIVERKGIGHPDTICDAIMEEVSRSFSREYVNSFGRILHHDCDEPLNVGSYIMIGLKTGGTLL